MKQFGSFHANWDINGAGAWSMSDTNSYPYLNTIQYQLSIDDDTNGRFAQSSAVEALKTGFNWTNGGKLYQILSFKKDGSAVVGFVNSGAGTKNIAYFPDTTTISNNDAVDLTLPAANTLQVQVASGMTATISGIAKAGDNATDSDLLYTQTSSQNISLEAGIVMNTAANSTFYIDGNIVTIGQAVTINAGTGSILGTASINASTFALSGVSMSLTGAVTATTLNITTTAGDAIFKNSSNNITNLGASTIAGGDFILTNNASITLIGAISNIGQSSSIKSSSINLSGGTLNADTVHLMQADNAAFSLDGVQTYNLNFVDIDAYITANTFNYGNQASPGIFHLTHPANVLDIEFLSTGFTNVNIYANGVYDNCALARHNSANVINNVGDILLSPCRDLQPIGKSSTAVSTQAPESTTTSVTEKSTAKQPISEPVMLIAVQIARDNLGLAQQEYRIIQAHNFHFDNNSSQFMSNKPQNEIIFVTSYNRIMDNLNTDSITTIKKSKRRRIKEKAPKKQPYIKGKVDEEEEEE